MAGMRAVSVTPVVPVTGPVLRLVSRWLAPVAVVAALSACAVPVPIPVPVSATEAPVATALSRVGRFALRVEEVGGKQNAVQGGFAWRDDGQNLVLDLVSPLGATLARVEAGPQGAMLREANGTETHALNPDALVALVLGSRIPVAGLRDWLRGTMPDTPPATVTDKDANGRPQAFEQAGWQVQASQYDAAGPTRMAMQRQEANGQTVDLRLVINTP
jgi:outer membrane lipoprotein LolB